MVGIENFVPRIETGYTALFRAATIAKRPGIVIVADDLAALDRITGVRSRSHDLIATLENAGRLRPVRRGAYVLVDPGGNVRVSVLDLVAALSPKPHLITAGRALQFHDLTDQHFRLIVVLASKNARPWSWQGERVRYSRTDRSLKDAAARTRRTRAAVATPERALADSLDHPSWGVTLAQVAEALDTMLRRDPPFADRLATEVALGYGPAAARRFGFLISRLAGDDAARAFLPLRGRSKATTKLLSGGAAQGPIDTRWAIQQNIDLVQLTQHQRL